MPQLEIQNLRVIGHNEIIRDLSLMVRAGEVHVIMGPNGSGKSTLAKVIAGYPDYRVLSGKVLVDGEDGTCPSAGPHCAQGREELALELEEKGYDWIRGHAEEPAFARAS